MKISSLATSKYITDKHWGYRDESAIKYIIPHHMAGKLSGAACAKYFVNNGLENSANYCIGYDGDISCNVPEEYGAWTSSFSLADKYAITIEVSDVASGDWRIPEKAQEALICLFVDLIQRYPSLGGKAKFDPSDEAETVSAKRAYRQINAKGNILLHKWTSAYGTSCPEWHMTQILPDICAEVNRRLSGGQKTTREVAQEVIDGKWGNGATRKAKLKAAGYDPVVIQAEVDLMLGKDKEAALKTLIAHMPVVQKGSEGDAVRVLQAELKRMGYIADNIAIDGIAGNITDKAIRQLQTNWHTVYGMGVDGKFGPRCWNKLLT